MYSRSRQAHITALAALAIAATACATIGVSSYVARVSDLGRYHTYAWGPDDTASTGDPRLDSNPLFQERVRADVEQQLATRGFEKTASAPELLLHYHASVTQKIDPNGVDQKDVQCDDCRPYVYDAGTLIIDVVDAGSRKLLWRGWAEGSIDGVIDSQPAMERDIDEAVARIMQQFPPRL
jgi:hypothetical protein